MADKFFAKHGVVKELREKLGIKQTAFDGVSDVIVRKMETGYPVSVKSARKVARTLNVTLERLADDPEAAAMKTPEIDVRVDSGRESYGTYQAHRVTGEEIAAMLEGTFDQRFVAYGPIYGIRADNQPRKEALEDLERLVKQSREDQLTGYRETIVASSVKQLLSRGQFVGSLQTCIETLEEQGIHLLAANVLNKDWYQYIPEPDAEERYMFPDADFENDFKRFRQKWVTIIVLTTIGIDVVNIVASEATAQSLELLEGEDIPF